MIWLFFLLLSDPVLFQARMSEGIAALDRGDLQGAQASFEAATKLADDPGAWMMLAQTLARENESRRAREAADKAEALGATDPRILQALANFYTTLVPDLRKAASVGAQYAAKAPADVTAWRKVAAIYLEIGDSDRRLQPGAGVCRRITAPNCTRYWDAPWRAARSGRRLAPNSRARSGEPVRRGTPFSAGSGVLVPAGFHALCRVLQDARKVFDKSPQIELALGVTYYGQRNFDGRGRPIPPYHRTRSECPSGVRLSGPDSGPRRRQAARDYGTILQVRKTESRQRPGLHTPRQSAHAGLAACRLPARSGAVFRTARKGAGHS